MTYYFDDAYEQVYVDRGSEYRYIASYAQVGIGRRDSLVKKEKEMERYESMLSEQELGEEVFDNEEWGYGH